jgi:predicted GNAT family N-acyltransferase
VTTYEQVEVLEGRPPEDAAALRREVFVGEQGVDPQVEFDADDHSAQHAVVRDDTGRVLGTGRLLDPLGELAWGRVGRMAVAAPARGHGVGHTVLRALERTARQRGLVGVELHAQRHAEGFYARAGYTAEGAAYLEEGIEHVTMRRSWLPGLRPARDADAGALQDLIGGCFAEYPGCVLDLDGIDAWMRTPASAEGRRVWVLPGRDGTDGALDASVGEGRGELKSLYVSRRARHHGIGESLVRLAERVGARELWSDVRFLDAHRLYERLGWRRTGEQRDLDDLSETTEWHFRPTSHVGAPD